jgi:hypothetical protein
MKTINIQLKFVLAFTLILVMGACSNSPKEVSSKSEKEKEDILKNSEIFGDGKHVHSEDGSAAEGEHTVVIKEVLPTQKYVYLKVSENGGEEFWIATLKQEV